MSTFQMSAVARSILSRYSRRYAGALISKMLGELNIDVPYICPEEEEGFEYKDQGVVVDVPKRLLRKK